MPKIDELFAKLKGAKIFSTIDLQQGYHHTALTDDSIPKTAFSTPWRKWEFFKFPFGLNQVPAYFMALINRVLEGFETFAIVYMDGILIFSVDEETHLKHIKLSFEKLDDARLKIKLSKCSFFKKHLHYLGHMISSEDILLTKEKTAAIKEMAPPTNVHEVQVVMGIFNYYKKFIPNFSEISKEIIQLTKKGTHFKWTSKRQLAFDTLKDYLT